MSGFFVNLPAATGTGSAGSAGSGPVIPLNSPNIVNISLTSSGVEYPCTLPAGTVKFILKSRLRAEIRIATHPGETTTNYFSIPIAQSYTEVNMNLPFDVVLYITSQQDNDTLELWLWS